MNATLDACLRSWPFTPWLNGSLLLSALIYLVGWRKLQTRDSVLWNVGRPAAFLGGLAAIFLALASPIETFSSYLLQLHMLQHLLLMIVAPPLIWLGWPQFPTLLGLPEPVRTYWLSPILRSRGVRAVFSTLTHPVVAWILFVAMTWLWHLPPCYELGLANDNWHVVQHVCFLGSSLLFWYPVIRPYPSRPRWGKWILFPYLLLADVQNTLLAAWLTFSSQVLYPHYLQVPRLAGISALDDQHAAGVLMWVPGSIAFLIPLFWLGVQYLLGIDRQKVIRRRRQLSLKGGKLIAGGLNPRFNFLKLPLIGQFLHWRYARQTLQCGLAIVAVIMIVDGLRGPQVAPMNLAGVLPWIHWRGVLILTLLIAGNFFCMACPFTLPRSLAGRWFRAARPWPRMLRSKWLATGLVVLFLWSYEAFALWDSPWITAWIVLGYFVSAFVVESFFSGAAFCKYVCPIGQFNFVQSLLSPLEVTVQQPSVCASCTTHDCLRGNESHAGCGMALLQPLKTGNMDCTFCLDCVHACPHENVGLFAVIPGEKLWKDVPQPSAARWLRRPDLAALILVLVFGAFANAAGMVAPVLAWQDQLQLWIGNPARLVLVSAFYLMALIIVPFLTLGIVTALSRRWGRLSRTSIETATRFVFALVPIACGMWLAHYSFHFLTSWETIVPATQRFAADSGWAGLGEPLWQCACCRPAGAWVLQAEVLMLDVGLLASLYVGFRIAESQATNMLRAVGAFLPWASVIVLLFLAGVWILFQPMEMRGTLMAGGESTLNSLQ